MPKQKAGIIIDTFEGRTVDWGVITGPVLREGLHAYQGGKKLRPIIQQYLTVLFPPRGLPTPQPSKPTPPPRSAKRRLAELATTEWEDEPQPAQPDTRTTHTGRSRHHEKPSRPSRGTTPRCTYGPYAVPGHGHRSRTKHQGHFGGRLKGWV